MNLASTYLPTSNERTILLKNLLTSSSFDDDDDGDKDKEQREEANSVTRLGDLLDFGQVFKAFGNN